MDAATDFCLKFVVWFLKANPTAKTGSKEFACGNCYPTDVDCVIFFSSTKGRKHHSTFQHLFHM